MNLIQEWRNTLRSLKEAPFSQYAPEGSNVRPPEDIPTINADEENSAISISIDALEELLNICGADQSEVSNIVGKIKLKGSSLVTVDDIKEIIIPPTESPVVPVAPNGLDAAKPYCFLENIEKSMNEEDIQIISKKEEKEET
jgi:hypothetical protein